MGGTSTKATKRPAILQDRAGNRPPVPPLAKVPECDDRRTPNQRPSRRRVLGLPARDLPPRGDRAEPALHPDRWASWEGWVDAVLAGFHRRLFPRGDSAIGARCEGEAGAAGVRAGRDRVTAAAATHRSIRRRVHGRRGDDGVGFFGRRDHMPVQVDLGLGASGGSRPVRRVILTANKNPHGTCRSWA